MESLDHREIAIDLITADLSDDFHYQNVITHSQWNYPPSFPISFSSWLMKISNFLCVCVHFVCICMFDLRKIFASVFMDGKKRWKKSFAVECRVESEFSFLSFIHRNSTNCTYRVQLVLKPAKNWDAFSDSARYVEWNSFEKRLKVFENNISVKSCRGMNVKF